jgi:hypothetical protein
LNLFKLASNRTFKTKREPEGNSDTINSNSSDDDDDDDDDDTCM